MNAFKTAEGLVLPLDRANVDTDQIIPKQFLKSIRRTGFGDNLFDAWRYLDEGEIGKTPNERTLNYKFVLNEARYQGANMLLTRRNFGCGSSREHAVWALAEYGFCCVIAPSFADIFYNNCFKNGFLPIVLDAAVIDTLFERIDAGEKLRLRVDLSAQKVSTGSEHWRFAIDAQLKQGLLQGLDEIGATLERAAAIRAFEADYRARRPWLFLRD